MTSSEGEAADARDGPQVLTSGDEAFDDIVDEDPVMSKARPAQRIFG